MVVILGYYFLVVGYLVIVRKREGARLNLVSMLFIIVAIIHDFYLYTNQIQSVQMVPYAILTTLLMQAIIISYRYMRFQQRNAQLTKDLQDINRDLEAKVIARTDDLNASNAQLMTLTSQRSRLMANIAHDMGSPLTGVKLSLHILTEDSLNSHEKQDVFSVLMTRIDYVKNLVDDLFRLASEGNIAEVEAVLRAGADPTQRGQGGKSVLLIARESLAGTDPARKVFTDEISTMIIDAKERATRNRRAHALAAFGSRGSRRARRSTRRRRVSRRSRN
jgi:signal transduction histidine kinase